MSELFIGLMSGTSLDGVDGVLADLTPGTQGPLHVLAYASEAFDADFRAELLALNRSGTDELHRAALAGNWLAESYARVVRLLLAQAACTPDDVKAIGAHGQTVRHRPGEFDGTGYTLQLNNPALLAERCGITVVADLRSRDLAAKGQGAPLVPAFHQALFARPGQNVATLNLGGIANLSLLPATGTVQGFDCGPGNALMDLWSLRHQGQPYDDEGRWAASGQVLPALLHALQAEPWLHLPPPKSTGRDLFNEAWLAARLGEAHSLQAADVQATLCEFTAWACASHLLRHAPDTRELVVCGGGAFNRHLLQRLSTHLPGLQIQTSAQRGLPPLQVEAAAFAWLAQRCLSGLPGNLPAVTGAKGPRVLGAIYPR